MSDIINTPLRKPPWLKVRLTSGESFRDVSALLKSKRLNTVCKSAHCPNIGECWGHGTATFMILGDICTRGCKFCAIATGKPEPVDEDEPFRIADAARAMQLNWVVLTSVDRDDLPDGGASHFAQVIRLLRSSLPRAGIEALVPDFLKKSSALSIICNDPPDVLNHNVETVARLYRQVRPGADYNHSLWLIEQFAKRGLITKSGLFVGIGESIEEIKETIQDLRNAGCRSLTIGQYLAPSNAHLPVDRYVHPKEFAYLADYAYLVGFDHVTAGPLVRSSYHAEEALKVFRSLRSNRVYKQVQNSIETTES